MIKDIKDSTVLIVDSAEQNLDRTSSLLKEHGFLKVEQAVTGNEGLEKARAIRPDVILLSLDLSDTSGLAVCKALKKNPKTKNISIIFQGSTVSTKQRCKAFELGANDLMVDPIDSSELMYRLGLQLKQRALYVNLLEAHLRMEKELQESAELLNSFLPSKRDLVELGKQYNISIDSYYLPSSILGGDFYGAFPINDSKMGFYLWDFSGHGVIAAINTLRLNSAIYNHKKYTENPGKFITNVNNTLYNINSRGSFATIFYGVIDKRNMTLEYSYASSPNPILLSFERNEFKFIDTKEFPLGVVSGHAFQTQSIKLDGWDAIILYSDALIETPSDVTGKFLSPDDLARIVLKSFKDNDSSVTASVIKEIIISEFDHNYRRNLKDDLTLKVIRF